MPFDQKAARVGWHAHGGMVEDDIAPAVQGKQPVYGREITAGDVVGIGFDMCFSVHGAYPPTPSCVTADWVGQAPWQAVIVQIPKTSAVNCFFRNPNKTCNAGERLVRLDTA